MRLEQVPMPPSEDKSSELIQGSRVLSIAQLCEWWGVSKKHIWQLTTQKKGDKRLPSYKVGRRRLFSYDECYWYLKKQETL